MSVTNGGSAFPQITSRREQSNIAGGADIARVFSDGGMSLRDYFAGQIAIGALVFRAAWPTFRATWPTYQDQREDFARDCYELADAMLAEREKGK